MNHSRTVFLAIALLALAACQPPKSGSGSTDTSPPVATVDGTPISRDFYDFYIKGITGGKAPADLTAQQRSAALDNLIRARLVGEEASKEGLDKSGDTPFLLQIARLNVLQQAVEEHYLKDRKPTEQIMQNFVGDGQVAATAIRHLAGKADVMLGDARKQFLVGDQRM